ncbi:helix-turn-helix domain-containing protein [Streptomyces syringium]|uniref:helix-turn-helix domain-containing protein n=1 Tax=Streptomyces syringium TaxID=76729 RepID=UPI0037CEF895
MAASAPRIRQCALCGGRIRQTGPGRPRRYCTPTCRRTASHRRAGRETDTRTHTCKIADDIRWRADHLWETAQRDAPLAAHLEHSQAIRIALDAYEAAVVGAARDRGDSWADIASTVGIAADSARRRWNARNREKAETRHEQRAERAHQTGGERDAPESGPRADRLGSSTYVEASRSPGRADWAVNRLAPALSHLQRTSRHTVRALAEAVGVSPSYISRIFSAERIPSWPVTAALAEACGASADDLRSLWNEARGFEPMPEWGEDAAVRAFYAAIRGLHLAASAPTPREICAPLKGKVQRQDVEALLDGVDIPSWPTVARNILRLHGRPAQMRPAWAAARKALDNH